VPSTSASHAGGATPTLRARIRSTSAQRRRRPRRRPPSDERLTCRGTTFCPLRSRAARTARAPEPVEKGNGVSRARRLPVTAKLCPSNAASLRSAQSSSSATGRSCNRDRVAAAKPRRTASLRAVRLGVDSSACNSREVLVLGRRSGSARARRLRRCRRSDYMSSGPGPVPAARRRPACATPLSRNAEPLLAAYACTRPSAATATTVTPAAHLAGTSQLTWICAVTWSERLVLEPHVRDVLVQAAAVRSSPRRDGVGDGSQQVVADGDVVRREVPEHVHVRLVQPEVQPSGVHVVVRRGTRCA
jgi:hypothetical protein